MHTLLVNADDFGISKESNEAIKEAIRAGSVNSVSVMVNTQYFEDAVAFLKKHPAVKVGLHFNITEGISRSSIQEHILSSIFRKRYFLNTVKRELLKQYLTLQRTGLHINHIDSHEHVHLIPAVFTSVSELAEKCKIERVRGCAFSLPQLLSIKNRLPSVKQTVIWLVYGLNYIFLPNNRKKLFSKWYLLDLNWDTNFSIDHLQKILTTVPVDAIEIICHLSSAITQDKLSTERYHCKNFLVHEFKQLWETPV